MPLRTDHVQAAGFQHRFVAFLPVGPHGLDRGRVGVVAQGLDLGLQVAAQHDVGAASGHVGGDGHAAGPSGFLDDLRLATVVLGVQHLVLDAGLGQQTRQQFGGLDRGGAHQHRLLLLVGLADLVDDRVELLARGHEHQVTAIVAHHVPIGRDHDHFEVVYLLELEGLGIGRAGHAGQLVVEAEVVLEGDRGQRLVFLLDRHAFLGLHGLVQAVGPAAPGHHPARELVDDDHLAITHDVFHVAPVHVVGAQRGIQVVHQHDVAGVVEALTVGDQSAIAQQFLDALVTFLGQVYLLVLLLDAEVAWPVLFLLTVQGRNDLVDLAVQVRVVVGRTRDDQRRAGLVDQDRVDLVDDGEVQLALHLVLQREGHVVAQVVEAELVVGAVGDVGRVGLALLVSRLSGMDHADAHAQGPVDAPHPIGVAPRQVIVDGDHVHALARQCVQVSGQRRDQGLALAGLHLRDLSRVKHRTTDQLHVEVAHLKHPLAGLANHREGLGHQLVQRLAVGDPLPELVRLGGQLRIVQRLQPLLEAGNAVDQSLQAPNQPLVAAAENSRQKIAHR